MTILTAASALIVPVDVSALCVGDADAHRAIGHFGDIVADFSKLPYQDANGTNQNTQANIAENILPHAFDPAEQPPSRGIHLHWALPDALTRGTNDGSGRLRFATVPNRWLVVRLAGGWADPTHPNATIAAWVIESDQLWDRESDWSSDPASGKDTLPQNGMSRAIPWTASDGSWPKPYAFLGRVYPAAGWSEGKGTHYASDLTAIGYGISDFAAAYPHCPNVFGFYDPVTDLDGTSLPAGASSLSYAVIGWYSDSTRDPLASFSYPANASTIAQQIAALEAAFGWTFVQGKNGQPGHILCNGLIHGITWNPVTNYLQTYDGKGIDVAIGHTTAEAVSALIAQRHPELAGIETLLNLFQLGRLNGIAEPNALSDADEDLHQAGFGTRSGGTIWTIVRRNAANSAAGAPVNLSDADVMAAAAPALPLNDTASELLNQLNLAQQQVDGQRFAFQSCQRQLFSDWYKYMLIEYPPPIGPAATSVSSDQAFQFLRDEITALLGVDESASSDRLADIAKWRDYALSPDPAAVPPGAASTAAGGRLAALVTLRALVTTHRTHLEKELGPDFLVVAGEAPRYWQANDPVLLLSGDAMRPSSRYGGDGHADPNDYLHCRTPDQIVVSLAVATTDVGPGDLPALPTDVLAHLPPEVASLIAEASLIDPNRNWLLADIVSRRGGPGAQVGGDRNSFAASLQAAQKAIPNGTLVTEPFHFSGQAPSIVGVNGWTQPWIPLLVQWEAELRPPRAVGYPLDSGAARVSTDYPADIILDGYTLDEDEVELRAKSGQTLADAAHYGGSFVLAASAEINLAAQISSYVTHHPVDSFAAELQRIGTGLDFRAMAQALSGFNEALQMRAQTLQLNVADPLASGILPPIYANSLLPLAIGRQNRTAPQPEQHFNPLRAGDMRLSRLRVLDAFGQIRDIIDVARIDGSVANPKPAVTDRLRAKVDVGTGATIELPPRLAQPSRLLFRWLSATDSLVETNSHPAASPICGWVLFNQLDDSLMVYDAAGNALGSLNVTGPVWQDAPGAGSPSGDPISRATTALQAANPHLRAFVMGILQREQSQGYLAAMLDAIDRQMTAINPLGFKQDQGLSLLVGRPLALTRASVRLEVMGLKSADESWAAYAAAINMSQTNQTRFAGADAGLGSVKFQLRLGDLGLLDDGLVGYFLGDDADAGIPAAYGTFYASAMNQALGPAAMAADPTHGVVAPDPTTIALTATASDDMGANRILSLLVDPRGVVHATTGILPVKAISIPDDMYSEALSRMAVTFLSAPMIGNSGRFAAPLPRERDYSWSWVTRTAGTSAWSEVAARSPANINALPPTPQQIEEGWLCLRKASAAPPQET